jgi:hypothetical protein
MDKSSIDSIFPSTANLVNGVSGPYQVDRRGCAFDKKPEPSSTAKNIVVQTSRCEALFEFQIQDHLGLV